MSRFYMLHKIKRRAEVPVYHSLPHSTCYHTFGATGVELFRNGARWSRSRPSRIPKSRTAKLYDHTREELSFEEVVRIKC